MDLRFSADGRRFSPVRQEVASPSDAAVAMANGRLGEWNGGLLMGVAPAGGLRVGQWTHALLPFADSGAHFMADMRELRNFSASAIQAWGEKQFFGPSIEQWPQWQTVGGVGGWAGLAAAGEKLRIEVGAVRWRTEGWVALRATADAWLKTKPLKLTADQSCPRGVMATINLRGRGATTVELARADGKLLPTHSGAAAATLHDTDDVAAPLGFGPGRALPHDAIQAGTVFVVHMPAGSELFGISLRCISAPPLRTDDLGSPLKLEDPGLSARDVLSEGWTLSPSVFTGNASARAISSVGFEPRGWLRARRFPATALAAAEESGRYGAANLYHSQNMRHVPVAPFNSSWWYRTEFETPPGKRVWLRLKGINYRADVWLNGVRVAARDSIVGAYRYFTLDVTAHVVADHANALAVEVFRPQDYNVPASGPLACPSKSACRDLAISFVDWAPTPPDASLGIWREVEVFGTGNAELSDPAINTTLSEDGRRAEVVTGVAIRTGAAPVAGWLRGNLSCAGGPFAQRISLPPNSSLLVRFDPIRIDEPQLWWPWQMGNATLHTLSFAFFEDGDSAASDEISTRVGLRSAEKVIDRQGHALFKINHKPLLIRGAGWAPDLLLRMTAARHRQELLLARSCGLNALRFEGKLQSDDIFSIADEMGMLMIPGLCCCDSWMRWEHWGEWQCSMLPGMPGGRCALLTLVWRRARAVHRCARIRTQPSEAPAQASVCACVPIRLG